ncbi:MAG: class I SAM-dependent methyltransferase [Isosphaeraceae bacterium]
MESNPASAARANSYDVMPYEGRFVAASHPDRMAAMATVFGMTPPPVDDCRVLELGCADGGNLLAIAQTLPRANLVGIDFSPRQILDGQAAAQRLGARNVELQARSIMEVGRDLGQFDYIVCHGVYSWVPADEQAKILEICATNLVPGGVAYVSYNTYPGWHLREVVRDALRFHIGGLPKETDSARLIAEARGLIDFLAASATPADGLHAIVLRHEAEFVRRARDAYLFHEHLEAENHPVYYHQFAAAAESHGLVPFAPARFDLAETGLPNEARQTLARLGTDPVRREQYLDFLLNRTFRQTLLVHATAQPQPAPFPGRLDRLRLTALARPEADDVDVRAERPMGFVSIYGDRLTVGQPLLKAAVVALYERWPRSTTMDQLGQESVARLGWDPSSFADQREAFAALLIQGFLSNLISLHTVDPPIAVDPPARPRATPLAREQAASGSRVGNLRHGQAMLDDIDRMLLPLLDGSRDLPALIDEVASRVADGTLQVHHEAQLVRDLKLARSLLAEPIQRSLWKIAGEALLLADD